MPVEDERMEGSVSSLEAESLDSNHHGDVLSAEDLAWVDSCLVKDPEVPDDNWDSLRNALLEIVDLNPEVASNSTSGTSGLSVGTDIEMHHPDEDTETAQSQINDYIIVRANEESESSNDSYPINNTGIPVSKLFEGVETIGSFSDSYPINNTGIPVSKLFEDVKTIGSFVGNPFLPSYKEDESMSKPSDFSVDLNSLSVEIEPLSENIFKVWDLDVADEEDELITKLNKALTETPSLPVPSVFDELGTWKDLKDDSLSNLITGIADLSLNKRSS